MSYFPYNVDPEAQAIYEQATKGVNTADQLLLGKATSLTLVEDPKLLLFVLARYKFVLKMLEGRKRILEIGCQEGFGAKLLECPSLEYVGIDFYSPYINEAKRAYTGNPRYQFFHHDVTSGTHDDSQFDAVFSLDVLEHISKENEHNFFKSSISYLHDSKGPLIIGMPSLESQEYASKRSKLGHVNCQTKGELKKTCEHYFENVFMFSMNDEILHTGFSPMSHYIIALCVSPKER